MTDKAPSIASAFRKLQTQGLYSDTEHRTVKYPNTIMEQEHRSVKRRNKHYQCPRTPSSTITDMDNILVISTTTRRNGTLFGSSVTTEIKVLMGITA